MILIQITVFEICDLLQNLRRKISNLPDILRQCLLIEASVSILGTNVEYHDMMSYQVISSN